MISYPLEDSNSTNILESIDDYGSEVHKTFGKTFRRVTQKEPNDEVKKDKNSAPIQLGFLENAERNRISKAQKRRNG